ncbi:hypothetical protein CLV59_104199 [Chitinophaga dinghuensis]|uniref:Uncharacterized protein n=1 Tax=Chitinophaga dinghuensis TaxID=1539050 RepID=A0A327W1S1_9BACT|nr:hypothetical protein CLV59_104199 [Chitinophaga dinghuensis]
MKLTKLLLLFSGIIAIFAGALASFAKHTSRVYVNDAQSICQLTIFSLTTAPVGPVYTVTFASTQPLTISCPEQLTLYKAL